MRPTVSEKSIKTTRVCYNCSAAQQRYCRSSPHQAMCSPRTANTELWTGAGRKAHLPIVLYYPFHVLPFPLSRRSSVVEVSKKKQTHSIGFYWAAQYKQEMYCTTTTIFCQPHCKRVIGQNRRQTAGTHPFRRFCPVSCVHIQLVTEVCDLDLQMKWSRTLLSLTLSLRS